MTTDDLMPRGLAHLLYDAGYRLPATRANSTPIDQTTAFEQVLLPAVYVDVSEDAPNAFAAGILVGAGTTRL